MTRLRGFLIFATRYRGDLLRAILVEGAMTAIEAMIYCLGFVDEKARDGEYRSQTVYDAKGDPHWVIWLARHGQWATPKLCSEGPHPFAKALEPYDT